MASNGGNFPEIKLKTNKNRATSEIKWLINNKYCTLLYSQRKPERGMAISCKGLLITLSMKSLTFGGCKYQLVWDNWKTKHRT